MKKCEQTSIFDGEKRFKLTKPVRLVELFAGIGAQAKALENLGVPFEHYFVCENDRFAVASYNAIHGTGFEPCDVTKITANDINVVDTDKFDYILTYSFPCTDLSTAGQMRGMSKDSGTRSSLLWEVERLLSEMEELPQVLIMENVPQVAAQKNERDFRRWLEFLAKIGYRSFAKILNAKDYGIPQNRQRMFVVSIREGWRYEFPSKVEESIGFKNYLDFSEEYAIDITRLSKTQKNCLKKLQDSEFSKTIRTKGRFSYDGSHTWDVYSVELNQSEKFIKNKTLWLKNLSKTICVQHPTMYTLDGKVYFRYSPRECFRLMGFADADYEKAASVSSKTQLYKQAGNSIVTTCLTAIFGTMTDVDYVQKINDLTVGLTERRKV